ncbi:hypothetical protein [Anaerotalea alkaliphila]|uniref:Uncharacterized protein n=1 Tax=Anaerotalea alkaliphila TaxID=2662126 RepID=A0A7X5KL97_9FIRM|nr:hypothetical protein [Anaerotalea alkaliphila]NDL66469.1 hypothetical protein [Anaerotalea alkaliphila]
MDHKKLRDGLVAFLATAGPIAAAEIIAVQTAKDEALVEIAGRLGFDTREYERTEA